jgi:hypothetical protein
VQYEITSDRTFQLGNKTECKNVRLVSFRIGARVNEVGNEGFRIDVDEGSNGEVVLGVSRAFRFVDMLSSMLARDRRRKSLSTRVLKQNWGVRFAGSSVGFDIIRGWDCGEEATRARLVVGGAGGLSLGIAEGACE